MQIDLTPLDIETLLESLKYSERNVRDAAGTPFAVRQEDLQRLASVTDKLRAARKPRSLSENSETLREQRERNR